MSDMKRREFIAFFGGAAAAWPLVASAQQPAMPVIGYFSNRSFESEAYLLQFFRKGLQEAGYVIDQNAAIELRFSEGRDDLLPGLAADLVRRRVAVIATPTTPAAIAAKAATTTIPIVFAIGYDPVALGLVTSLNRPGGNATGISFLTVELTAKRFGLLRELVPGAARFVALVNPGSAWAEVVVKDLREGASSIGVQVEILYADSDRAIDAAFANLALKPGALLISPDALFTSRRAQLATLAMRHAIPTIHVWREFADSGGLMSYGPNLANVHRQTGIYTGRILKGEKPADLPVAQPTKFELVINLITAKALGIAVPPTLLALADEVIE
jgi:putative ABC transport system substrate-binding protein